MYSSKKIADNIRTLSKEHKISQKDLLSKCDLGVNTITKLSNGTDILVKNLVKIADELNCSIDYLIGRSDMVNIQKTGLSSDELLLIKKLRALPKDGQDEIIHIINYKYEQYQQKKMKLSSTSGSTTADNVNDMLA